MARKVRAREAATPTGIEVALGPNVTGPMMRTGESPIAARQLADENAMAARLDVPTPLGSVGGPSPERTEGERRRRVWAPRSSRKMGASSLIYSMTIANTSGTLYGVGTVGTIFGSITSAKFMGELIARHIVRSTDDFTLMELRTTPAGVQAKGIDDIRIEVVGGPVATLSWSVANDRYEGTNASYTAHLISEVGNTIQMTITEA